MQDHTVSIVDYGMGNIGSVVNMIKKAGGSPVIVSTPNDIANAKKLLLPGVGAFDSGMTRLKEKGLDISIRDSVLNNNVPILGICLGMQLLLNSSEEGVLSGLRLVDGQAKRFSTSDSKLKVPHMGWNSVKLKREHHLVQGLDVNRFYFVHSYFVECENEEDILGETHYISDFVSVIQHRNCYGAQFHPEKSHKFGLSLLRNYISL